MQDKHLFEYAVIRLVPRVEREEFLNIGIILYCAKQRFLKMTVSLNEERIRLFCKEIDIKEIENNLLAFERVCMGGEEGGTIGMLTIAERFRWLTATRSTVVQTSKVHPGFCVDPGDKLNQLHHQLVL